MYGQQQYPGNPYQAGPQPQGFATAQPPINPYAPQAVPLQQQPPVQSPSVPPPSYNQASAPQYTTAPPPVQGQYGYQPVPGQYMPGYPGQPAPAQYNPAAMPPPPAGTDPQVWGWFVTVDQQRIGQLNAQEVTQALSYGEWPRVSHETIRIIVNIFDVQQRGTIGFPEFAQAVKYIRQWYGCFARFDQDRSMSMDKSELKNALKSFGYNIQDVVIDHIARKYCKPPSTQISFENFMLACVNVKALTEVFQRYDTKRNGYATLSYDQFLDAVFRSL